MYLNPKCGAPDLGNEVESAKEQCQGSRRRVYSPEEKAAAVRMVRTLRAELGSEHGTVQRVARQLGCGIESLRFWVRQADIDDAYASVSVHRRGAADQDLEQENRELTRANAILKRAASFFSENLDRHHPN